MSNGNGTGAPHGTPIDAEPFVRAPHDLVLNMEQVSHPAFRLWCVLFILWWYHQPHDTERLMEIMKTTDRSIYRWTKELEAAQWLVWNRNTYDQRRRLRLRQTLSGVKEAELIARIRATIYSKDARIEDIRAILEEETSDTGVTSDSSVTSDTGVTSDTTIRSDTDVKSGDPTISGFDPTIKSGDPTISGSDPGVRSSSDLGLPEATNDTSSDHDQISSDLSDPPPPDPPGGDGGHTPTRSAGW